ncbi:Rhomboid family protein [Prosthecobacter debontii]|uniref:Rhomboid family protein n=1 Tax=Prosthecobacter debontii TaxID=48467 RepID=A0A1T4YDB8_9BACT|nr:rhomboid family intramembrane serine protease [Prosthecobacter debontii]SKA99311.1 Rhomboid family protein [Prosthecobacter debontii]
MLIIPYEIETLQQERPWANWLLVAACTLTSLFFLFDAECAQALTPLVLQGFSLTGLLGNVLLHQDLIHLVGNMLFLWVFGNAICMNIGNLRYLAVFVGCTLLAGVAQVLLDGSSTVGASGAINGIVGMVLAMYPLNRVYLFWFFAIRGGSFSCQAWVIILAWFAFDVWGALGGGDMVAYWAHLGGFLGGVSIGLSGLHLGWFQLICYDNRSLLQILRKEPLEG